MRYTLNSPNKEIYKLKSGQKIWFVHEFHSASNAWDRALIEGTFVRYVELGNEINYSKEYYFVVKDRGGNEYQAKVLMTTPEEAALEKISMYKNKISVNKTMIQIDKQRIESMERENEKYQKELRRLKRTKKV